MTTQFTDAKAKEHLDHWLIMPEMHMLFTTRLALQQEFESYAQRTGVMNCAMNFISWLNNSRYAKRFAEAIKGE